MCGRYWIDAENEEMQQIIAQMNRQDVKEQGEIFPGDKIPALCRSRAGNVKSFAMEWGFRMKDGKRIINARSETAAAKPLFAQSMRERRCLLPMSAYFEWEHNGKNSRKYRFTPQAEGLHYLAALYRMEETGPACTVLTMEAADEISFVHPRMPVVLDESEREAWLGGAEMEFKGKPLLCACEDGQLRLEFE